MKEGTGSSLPGVAVTPRVFNCYKMRTMVFETILLDFLYYGVAVAGITTASVIIGDFYGRKSKKDEYVNALEAMERIHSAKMVKKATEEPAEKSEEKK